VRFYIALHRPPAVAPKRHECNFPIPSPSRFCCFCRECRQAPVMACHPSRRSRSSQLVAQLKHGKPIERWGRKVTGLTGLNPKTAELPVRVKSRSVRAPGAVLLACCSSVGVTRKPCGNGGTACIALVTSLQRSPSPRLPCSRLQHSRSPMRPRASARPAAPAPRSPRVLRIQPATPAQHRSRFANSNAALPAASAPRSFPRKGPERSFLAHSAIGSECATSCGSCFHASEPST
jgi:hypothetical protein